MYKVMYNRRMGRMIRKQVYITPAQDRVLKRRAASLGISEAEVIRQSLAQFEESSVSYPTRPGAWREAVEFMKERAARLPDLKGKRTWKREDAYEERFARYSR
jgi:hypothetical protein